MPDQPTLTTIAAALRKHSPGRVPDICIDHLDRICFYEAIDEVDHAGIAQGCYTPLPDDIARHVIGFAMVLDCYPERYDGRKGWLVNRPDDSPGEFFNDFDHNNDPLLSLFSAWKFAKGIADA